MSTDEKIQHIKGVISRHTRVPLYAMEGPMRLRQYVIARHLAAYLCRVHTNATMEAIGQAFGGRHHSSIVHATQATQAQMDVDAGFRREVEELSRRLTRDFTTIDLAA